MPTAVARVRPLRWTDLETAIAIEHDLFPVDAWSVETFWGELAGVPETRCYVAAVTDAGDVVGYAGVMTVPPDADLLTLAVARTAQGRGIGRLLLHALLRTASDRGCTQMFLEVRSDNDAAASLYRANGFEAMGRRRDYYAPGVDALTMRLRPLPRIADAVPT
jgi:ribosomal-protein-alanine N-acetyltransferase